MKQPLFILAVIFTIFTVSCKKDSFISDGNALITVTADSLRYDTVFTTTGSVTRSFKIINTNDQKLRISEIMLFGGTGSFFRINADGNKGPVISNIEMEAHDSIYVFATVSASQNNAQLPFVINDSIAISFNGNRRLVHLEAYGQNAHFIRNGSIAGNIFWPNDLPYVILDGLVVNQNARLTIEKGARVYFHADAPMIVDGTLVTEGNDSTRVYFRGDRLDDPYSGYPGSWPGIYFRETSRNNVLNSAVIKNSYQGLIAEGASPNLNPKLTLNGCIIDNIYDAGILGIRTSITATNCLISNAGGEVSNNVSLVYGGNYDFNHCTVVSYGNSYVAHKNPVFYLSNYVISNNIKYPLDLTASFRNCIFWGENGLVDDEVMVAKDGSTIFNVQFTNCLYKVKNDPSNAVLTGILKNTPPLFDSTDAGKRYFDFHLKSGSPAINKGVTTAVTKDLDGKTRSSPPDIGAYEKQ